jgi:hypothetical protein
MTARASCKMRPLQDDDLQPDLAAVMIARAMAEMFQDEPDCRMPEPLAAILRQMERWEEQHAHRAAFGGALSPEKMPANSGKSTLFGIP